MMLTFKSSRSLFQKDLEKKSKILGREEEFKIAIFGFNCFIINIQRLTDQIKMKQKFEG